MIQFQRIENPRYYAQIATDLFMGNGANVTCLEGNPWQWSSNAWHLKIEFDIKRDFPIISVWVTIMSPASLKMCFRHNTSDQNITRNQDHDSPIENNSSGNFLDFSKLRADLPRT